MARRKGLITKRGDTYLIRLYLGKVRGKRRYYNETVNGSHQQAQKRLAELIIELDEGKLIQTENITVAELLKLYFEQARGDLAASTCEQYQQSAEHYLLPAFGTMALKDLHARDVQALYSELLARGLAPNTIRLAHVVLNRALSYGLRFGYTRYRATEYAKPPKVRLTVQQRALDRAELEHLLEVARGYKWHLLFCTLAYSGLRLGEALALRWKDVNLEAQELQVLRTARKVGGRWVFKTPKTKSGLRMVDIPERLCMLLAPHQAGPEELLFSNGAGAPASPRSVEECLKRVVQSAGLGAMRVHDLRHTYATTLLQGGVPSSYVAQQLGHASEVITHMVYSHVTIEHRVRMRSRVNALFSSSHTNSHTKAIMALGRRGGKIRKTASLTA